MASPETFGATTDDVLALLPELEVGAEASEIGGESQPSTTDVQRYINLIAAWVRGRTGDIPAENPDKAGEENPSYAFARTVVTFGAAVWVDSGAFPERADVSDTSLAGFLYKTYKDALDDLLESLGIDPDGGDGGGGVAPEKPAASFPAPLFSRDRAY